MKSGTFTVIGAGETLKLTLSGEGDVQVEPGSASLRIVAIGPETYRVTGGGTSCTVVVSGDGDERQAFVDGEVFRLEARPGDVKAARTRAHADFLAAPMPAKVTGILVRPGNRVSRGDLLVTLEAMKMELPLRAPKDGRVVSISCHLGELVQPGLRLVELEP